MPGGIILRMQKEKTKDSLPYTDCILIDYDKGHHGRNQISH